MSTLKGYVILGITVFLMIVCFASCYELNAAPPDPELLARLRAAMPLKKEPSPAPVMPPAPELVPVVEVLPPPIPEPTTPPVIGEGEQPSPEPLVQKGD